MSGLNRVTLIGNLGQDPEITHSQAGNTIAKISVATSDGMKKQGEEHAKTEWHRVVAFGKTAEYIEKYVKKGGTVCVEGSIQYGKYENKEGQTVYTTDIICRNLTNLTKRESNGGNGGYQQPQQSQQTPAPFNVDSSAPEPDDLPF